MRTVDERLIRAPVAPVFALAREVDRWPSHLAHYRHVRFWERTEDGGGLVEMAANRPFGPLQWPTWWVSRMTIETAFDGTPIIRYTHVEGITSGMNVAWTFSPVGPDATHVSIVHEWTGPGWPVVGRLAANRIIGPVFVHAIASRTLRGLATVAERGDADPRNI